MFVLFCFFERNDILVLSIIIFITAFTQFYYTIINTFNFTDFELSLMTQNDRPTK